MRVLQKTYLILLLFPVLLLSQEKNEVIGNSILIRENGSTLGSLGSEFLDKDDSILYTSCFDANGGLFETLFDSEDVIISDQLNHASIIDGVRLCKADRFRYSNSDMNQLEDILKKSSKYKHRLITTDGVLSMDGYIAKLDIIYGVQIPLLLFSVINLII